MWGQPGPPCLASFARHGTFPTATIPSFLGTNTLTVDANDIAIPARFGPNDLEEQLVKFRPAQGRDLMATLLVLGVNIFLVSAIPAHAQHDRSFWVAIAKNKYAVPEHESADDLSHELSALLASPDPELRDDLAYSILTTWVYRKNSPISTPTLTSLTDEWRANLKSDLGESGTNSVLKRSFSALCLSSMTTREAKLPFMGEERYHQLVA